MDVTVWALVPVVCMVVTATAAVLIVVAAVKGTPSRDRARILEAVAEVVRAVRGRR
ncbi:hypothetical protein [Streptomyces virginiae]